jgi:hypothetical protein
VDRITGFRRDLEGRLRNTIRYAETSKDGLSSRSHELIEVCDRVLADEQGRACAARRPDIDVPDDHLLRP